MSFPPINHLKIPLLSPNGSIFLWVSHAITIHLVGGFKPSEKILVSWDACSQYMGKYKMFQSPPTSMVYYQRLSSDRFRKTTKPCRLRSPSATPRPDLAPTRSQMGPVDGISGGKSLGISWGYHIWLVVEPYPNLKNMKVNWDDDIPN